MRDHSELTIRKQNEFNRVYKRGSSKGSRFVVILYNRNNLGYNRTAFVASKKVGNSVNRNRARRLMRAAYSSLKNRMVEGYDIIFVARNPIIESKCEEVERSLFGVVRAAGLIK